MRSFSIPKKLSRICFLTAGLIATSLLNAEEKFPPEKLVQQFLGKYCTECHDADVQ